MRVQRRRRSHVWGTQLRSAGYDEAGRTRSGCGTDVDADRPARFVRRAPATRRRPALRADQAVPPPRAGRRAHRRHGGRRVRGARTATRSGRPSPSSPGAGAFVVHDWNEGTPADDHVVGASGVTDALADSPSAAGGERAGSVHGVWRAGRARVAPRGASRRHRSQRPCPAAGRVDARPERGRKRRAAARRRPRRLRRRALRPRRRQPTVRRLARPALAVPGCRRRDLAGGGRARARRSCSTAGSRPCSASGRSGRARAGTSSRVPGSQGRDCDAWILRLPTAEDVLDHAAHWNRLLQAVDPPEFERTVDRWRRALRAEEIDRVVLPAPSSSGAGRARPGCVRTRAPAGRRSPPASTSRGSSPGRRWSRRSRATRRSSTYGSRASPASASTRRGRTARTAWSWSPRSSEARCPCARR